MVNIIGKSTTLFLLTLLLVRGHIFSHFNIFKPLSTYWKENIGQFSFQNSNLTNYKQKIEIQVLKLVEQFRQEQQIVYDDFNKQFNLYKKNFTKAYEDTLKTLSQRRNIVNDLDVIIIKRPKQIDESLEQFRQWYDEVILKYNVSAEKIRFEPIDQTSTSIWNSIMDTFFSKSNQSLFSKPPFDQLYSNLDTNWKLIQETANENIILLVNQSLKELELLQDEKTMSIKELIDQSQEIIRKTLNTTEIVKEKQILELKIKQLEKSRTLWIESKKEKLNEQMKYFQDKILISNKLYEELLMKRRDSVEYNGVTDETLRKLLSIVDPSENANHNEKSEIT
jgi:hypothetical protein